MIKVIHENETLIISISFLKNKRPKGHFLWMQI